MLTTIPFTTISGTKSLREYLGTSNLVDCGSGSYGIGEKFGVLNGLFLGGSGLGAGYMRAQQIGVPANMIKVTRWGSQGLSDGMWVSRGSKNYANWLLSGGNKVGRYDSGATHIVPRSSLRSPYSHGNDARPAAVAKEFLGINRIQAIYKGNP